MSDCETIEAQLPLLAYPDELSRAEREELLSHLAGCAGCRALQDELEEAAAGLDQVPLQRPDPARWAGLKERVLAAVAAPAGAEEGGGQGCPQEQELLAREALSPAELGALDAHLAGCGSCREAERAFGLVGRALDRWPAPVPAGLAGLRAQVLAEVAPAPAGLLVRFRPLAGTVGLAAAVLLGAWLALAPRDARAALDSADFCVLQGQLEPAKERYRRLLDDGRLGERARQGLEALERYQSAQAIPDADARVRTLAELVKDCPDAAATTAALHALVRDRAIEPSQVASGIAPAPLVLDPTRPIPLKDLRLTVSPRVVAALNDRTLELAVRFQSALRAEVQGDVITARALYRELIELDPTSVAAQRAQERLARLG